jgi:hypothetical protein
VRRLCHGLTDRWIKEWCGVRRLCAPRETRCARSQPSKENLGCSFAKFGVPELLLVAQQEDGGAAAGEEVSSQPRDRQRAPGPEDEHWQSMGTGAASGCSSDHGGACASGPASSPGVAWGAAARGAADYEACAMKVPGKEGRPVLFVESMRLLGPHLHALGRG